MTAKAENPALRQDLKISKQVMTERVNYVVKDTLKGEYFRFDADEWRVIEMFDGSRSLEEIVQVYNAKYPGDTVDIPTLREFEKSLADMHLLQKSQAEMNVMLIEKMKEMRKSQLLAKQGSLFYKRFPLVDPDRFFNKVIPKLGFFWTKKFFLISLATMLFAGILVFLQMDEFKNGVFEVFTFSKMSAWNLAVLWVTIYLIIAIHELGHGLTCKYYGGEVHEIGFLLLFFQPCLYANVNDAWLFDKKWKQVMVTIAGGYIEMFVGAIFAIIWFISNPNTSLNVISLQVMTICSLSTIAFNFNPLVKLDGYYLLADYLEIPNLRDSSFDYLKYFVSRYVFRMNKPDHESTRREKITYMCYGLGATFWVTSLTLGLYYMAKDLLIEHFHEIGVLVSFFVGYKILGGDVKKIALFLFQWGLSKRQWLKTKPGMIGAGGSVALLLVVLFFPVVYSVRGKCSLEAKFSHLLKARSQGILRKFNSLDGTLVEAGTVIAEIENTSLETDALINQASLEKLRYKLKSALRDNVEGVEGVKRELAAKESSYLQTKRKIDALQVRAQDTQSALSLVSCPDQIRKLNSFVQEGDEICRVEEIGELKTVVEVPEHQVGYIEVGNPVEFKLKTRPFTKYRGKVSRISDSGVPDPVNPKAKLYVAELLIGNPGDLRPGMTGVARIETPAIPILQFVGRKMANFFRLDLFF